LCALTAIKNYIGRREIMPECIVCGDTGKFMNPFDQEIQCTCGGPKIKWNPGVPGVKPLPDETTGVIGMKRKTKSDGWKTDYYKLPPEAEEIQDLIEYKNMNFAVANIFKACYRLGQKEGTTPEYDLNKILFFTQRELQRLGKEKKT